MLMLIKKMIPRRIFRLCQRPYHFVMGFIAALIFGFPSRKMIVVGVTGTTGKTTVVYMIAHALRATGLRVGYTSTAMFSDGKKDWLNDKKMTMVGRFFTQKMLKEMLTNACDVAIVETTSEGSVQYRHRFINYDVMLITGLYPEHIESHGGFEQYKNAKKELFAHLMRCKHKYISGKMIAKTSIVNVDDKYVKEFLPYSVDRKIGFAMQHWDNDDIEIAHYTKGMSSKTGVRFIYDEQPVQMRILGDFNATNAAAALSVVRAINAPLEKAIDGLQEIIGLPGRLERIDEGQDFTVIVDYAFEPVAVSKLYETIRVLEPQSIIHVLGSTGGGRDVARREKLGHIAGAQAQYVIVTNEDPYDDDPMEIIEGVACGAREEGKNDGRDLFLIQDREHAIEKAITLAQAGDVILITGKGSEQAIVGKNGVHMSWDDRVVVRRILQKRKK